jgi:hypothetical protein
MFKKIVIIALVSTLAAGCASVPMENLERTTTAKKFNPPAEGNSGLYIYRNSSLGAFDYRDVRVNEQCIGSSAPYVFFYEEVEGDKTHKVSSGDTTAFGDQICRNCLLIKVKSGMHYFIKQNMAFWDVGVELVDEEQGKEEVSKLDMAAQGTCRPRRTLGDELHNIQSIGSSLGGLLP